MIEIYKKMKEFKPVWLIIQPSIANLMYECLTSNNLPLITSISYVELTGEILDTTVRQKMKKLFDCHVANQYGANEVNSIAYECPCGNMHIMENNVYVEIIKDRRCVLNEMGEICITSLTNSAMPLIRYLIGDIGKLKRFHCECGNKAPILEHIYGRNSQWIINESNNKITPYIIVGVFNHINRVFNEVIIQYQVIQNSYTSFLIKLFLEDTDIPYNFIEYEIKRKLKEELNFTFNLEFKYYDDFFDKYGEEKHSFFFNLITQ